MVRNLLVVALVISTSTSFAGWFGGSARPGISYGPVPSFGAFGAIAYSPSSGAYGWSQRFFTRPDAETSALRLCSAPDCTPTLYFYYACGALAISTLDTNTYGWFVAPTLWEVEHGALAECNTRAATCTLRVSRCSY
jgi:hypothetical protein